MDIEKYTLRNWAKKENRLLSLMMLYATTTLFTATPVNANERPHPEEQCYQMDLKTGETSASTPSFITPLVTPTDTNSDGWDEAVLKITLNNPILRKSPDAVKITAYYDNDPLGISLNIGDSITSNGHAGDGGTQSNDAELQIGSAVDSALYGDLFVYGHDGIEAERGSQQLAQINNVVKKEENISFVISNDRIQYLNKAVPLDGIIGSPWLYALAGQPDSEGLVNYDIFASFNRVVAGGRFGSGVKNIKVCPIKRL